MKPADYLCSRYESIANDPKYRHFVRIPRRITRCFDYFAIDCDRATATRRLRAYYLFIGVIDNAIDSGQTEVGRMVLRQFEARHAGRYNATSISDIALVTEALKSEISDETYDEMVGVLHELSRAVAHERTAPSMNAYIEARQMVGRLTAKSSYLLIRPLIMTESNNLCRFMERVGEIGCLVDSVIDWNADRRSGLLNFQGSAPDLMRLLMRTVKSGLTLSIECPRLFGLFLEALADNVLDRFRTRPTELHVVSKGPAATIGATSIP